MSKEKIEITVVTYKEERLNYFTALYEKAKNKFDRLFKKHKDAPYLSDEFQKMSDAGHEAEFLGDVVKMLKQSEGCDFCKAGNEKCGTCVKFFDYYEDGDGNDRCSTEYGNEKCAYYKPVHFCSNCGAKMKGGE